MSRPLTRTVTRRSHGFTLVELLVVIGIIAVLISILLPAMQSARKQASTVKCLSNLRQVGQAFQFYSGTYKGAIPVVRQDTPDYGTNPMPGATNNVYWTDVIAPFLSKTGKSNFQLLSGAKGDEQFRAIKNSVLWGCPQWDGWMSGGTTRLGVVVFDNGYSMNWYPNYEANYPTNPAAVPPSKERHMRWSGSHEGKYYRYPQWTHASERMLLVDANLWLLGFVPVSSPGAALGPQNVTRALASAPGTSNIDFYRHGKYPPLNGTSFALNGGKVAYNVLFVDGHASTLSDRKEGYKAIRMRYP